LQLEISSFSGIANISLPAGSGSRASTEPDGVSEMLSDISPPFALTHLPNALQNNSLTD
jgi:hypothetical protein